MDGFPRTLVTATAFFGPNGEEYARKKKHRERAGKL
jgi:hypothetical protein